MKNYLRISIISIVFFILNNQLLAQVDKVGPIGITVKDMEKSVKYYAEVLGFAIISDGAYTGDEYEKLKNIFGLNIRVVQMKLGDEVIELTDYLTSGGRSIAEDSKPNDLSFQHIAIVVSDMEKAYRQLRKYNVEFVSTAPQTLPKYIIGAEGIKAFYFHDPDSHTLELIYFPKGKGQPKWQLGNGKIFLGIDHTAIGISDTEKSLSFFKDLLGIERKGESFNFGTEQEHLNNVEGASLHITALRSAAGPGVEFLQYLKPGIGKPYPADTKANDIWYWQTTLFVNDAEALFAKLKNANYSFVSKGVVHIKSKQGDSKSFIVKDPDGHAMLIKENFK
ncbi:MAG: VOC family protein [Ferruginibacter sp.]